MWFRSVVTEGRYHCSVPGLLGGVYEGLCDCFAPVDTCAKDIEEEGF